MSAPSSIPERVDSEVDANSEEKIDKSAEETTPLASSDLPSAPARVDPEADTTSEEKIDEEEGDPLERLHNFYANFFRDIEYGPASKKFKVQFDWAEERDPWEQPPIIAGGDDPSSVLGNLISDLDPVDAKRGRGDRKI